MEGGGIKEERNTDRARGRNRKNFERTQASHERDDRRVRMQIEIKKKHKKRRRREVEKEERAKKKSKARGIRCPRGK